MLYLMKRFLPLAAVLGVIAVTAARAQDETASADYRFGPYRATIPDLVDPARVEVTADGTIVVLEEATGRLARFDRNGRARGAIETDLLLPGGFAVRPDGSIVVADTGRHEIVILDSAGAERARWGGRGTEPGRFNEPRGVAISADRIFVADLGNHRVQVFDGAGGHLLTVGGFGAEEGRFNRPVDVAAAPDGRFFVADADNSRIQAFGADGRLLHMWGDWGPFRGLMDEPGGLAWHGDHLYVADTRNHRIQVWTGEGELLHQWGRHALEPHAGDGLIHYPADLAVAPDGSFAVLCEPFENRCQVFGALGAGEPDPQAAPARARKRKQTHFGARIATDGKLLVIAEPELHRTYLFEMSRDIPIVIGDYGERGAKFGQFMRMAGLVVSAADEPTVLVSDTGTRQLQQFGLDYDPDAPRAYSRRRFQFDQSWDLAHLTGGLADAPWVVEPAAILPDPQGGLVVVDPRNARLYRFGPDLSPRGSFDGTEGGGEPLARPLDAAFSVDGETIYVVDECARAVIAFDRAGRRVGVLGPAAGEERMLRPFGVAAGRDGFVYVTDAAAHRVYTFREDGTFVRAWGTFGQDDGQFWKPKGIVQDERGRLIVIDHGNHRAGIFSAEGEWLVSFGLGKASTKWDRERQEKWRREQREREKNQGGGS